MAIGQSGNRGSADALSRHQAPGTKYQGTWVSIDLKAAPEMKAQGVASDSRVQASSLPGERRILAPACIKQVQGAALTGGLGGVPPFSFEKIAEQTAGMRSA